MINKQNHKLVLRSQRGKRFQHGQPYAVVDATNKIHVLPAALTAALGIDALRALLVGRKELGTRRSLSTFLVLLKLRVNGVLILVRHGGGRRDCHAAEVHTNDA